MKETETEKEIRFNEMFLKWIRKRIDKCLINDLPLHKDLENLCLEIGEKIKCIVETVKK
tara:strand:+ start:208 stop:384 length:177 start_codon:yes stop_codon:yes gene_type:complete